MVDIEALIGKWMVAADSDGEPPKVTDEDRRALAVEYLKAQSQRKRIRGLPFLGMSEDQQTKHQDLGSRMGIIRNFVRETLIMEHGWVSDGVVMDYIRGIAAEETAKKPRNRFSLKQYFG